MDDLAGPPTPADEELRRARKELARLADVERDLVFWRARAEVAEALAAQWRTVQGRTLWKLFDALDEARARVAPQHTRRERLVVGAARRAAGAMAPLRRSRTRTEEAFLPSGPKDVLFVYDAGGAWTVYRCDHLAAQLGQLGKSCDIVQSGTVELDGALAHYEAFILNRVEWNDDVATFIEAAHRVGKRVIFGTDDLIFEPELEGCFAFLDDATDAVRAGWRTRLAGYRRTLTACDAAIVSTDPLAEHARRHVGHVHVVYNTVSQEMVRLADEALEQRPNAGVAADDDRDVTIGYLSGTPGHNRDFLEAADAVLWALDTYPGVRVLVVGTLDLDRRFDTFEARITRVPKQGFRRLAALTARTDINLAPLERNNPFTECKSCVKFLEAALVGVPTVASPCADFARVIENGRNGILADHPSTWKDALGELIESSQRRRELGARARDAVREAQTTSARASELGEALGSPRGPFSPVLADQREQDAKPAGTYRILGRR